MPMKNFHFLLNTKRSLPIKFNLDYKFTDENLKRIRMLFLMLPYYVQSETQCYGQHMDIKA